MSLAKKKVVGILQAANKIIAKIVPQWIEKRKKNEKVDDNFQLKMFKKFSIGDS